ncbi:hypothetical protein [Sorangium cellulosum]|uniref:Uncharacterized protein n=1 Tax=Sorangium cellulosum TaxID=56 RepID=A0A150PXX3_SORCE|nr:hypothetical protein [Sorangium cellulosum]KYF60559.1 hypothetical protein BE15_12520 [Sorangium cellulosum]
MTDRAQGDAEAPRRTKKRAKRRDGEAASVQGDGAPGLPRDPELARLEQAFERGDYALVRAGAKRLLSKADPDELRGAAPAERHPYRPLDAQEADRTEADRTEADRTEADRAEVRRAARALLRRIEPDPLAVALLVAAAALLAFLSLWYWSHSHMSP